MENNQNTNTVPNKKLGKLDSFFGITASGSTIGKEIVAGIVTFLAMAYILVVNPQAILSENETAMASSSIFLATALGAVVGTLLMAFLAKLPLAQASGMGLNYAVGAILGGSLGFAVSYGNAMFMVLISGIIFLLLSVIKIKGVAIRELIFDGIPECVRGAISIGIGLFIAFIGMQNAGIIVPPLVHVPNLFGEGNCLVVTGTLVDMVAFNKFADPYVAAGAVVCLVGFITIAVLEQFKVKGSVIIGIIIATLVGIPMGVTEWSGESWAFWENFEAFFSMDPANGGAFGAAFTEGFNWAEGVKIMPIIMTIITFCMIDMFDTMGTVVGCCTPVGLVDEKGKPVRYNQIMMSDSVATCAGALFGTSTVTTFVESASGVAEGGRTGLTALTTAILFAICIVLTPLASIIPGVATAPALIYVGLLMLKNFKAVDMDDLSSALPAFIALIVMPLTYSISNGIALGAISYVLIQLFTGKYSKKDIVVTVIAILFVLRYVLVPAM